MHKRQAIREAVMAALTDKTSAQDRVSASRKTPWKRTDLPGISIYSLEEEASPDGRTRLTLAVELVVGVPEKVDDALDDLASQVEAALTNESFGPAIGVRYTGMLVEISEDQGLPVGAMRLTYEVWYLNT